MRAAAKFAGGEICRRCRRRGRPKKFTLRFFVGRDNFGALKNESLKNTLPDVQIYCAALFCSGARRKDGEALQRSFIFILSQT